MPSAFDHIRVDCPPPDPRPLAVQMRQSKPAVMRVAYGA